MNLPSFINPYLLRIDWKAYFLHFCSEHGRFPVSYKGRLLFPDGWMYSATSHEGPEWPPEEGEAGLLARRTYWLVRKRSVRSELIDLKEAYRTYKQLMEARFPVPLYQIVVKKDPSAPQGKQVTRESVPLNLANLEGRIDWLERDIVKCDKHVKEIDDERRAAASVAKSGPVPTVPND